MPLLCIYITYIIMAFYASLFFVGFVLSLESEFLFPRYDRGFARVKSKRQDFTANQSSLLFHMFLASRTTCHYKNGTVHRSDAKFYFPW